MRELAIQSSSETLANSERAYIQDEYDQLSQEVDRISAVTNFNGVNLADGSKSTLDVQVGIFNTTSDRIAVQLGDLRATSLAVDKANISLDNAASAQAALTSLDTAIDSINKMRSDFGSVQNRLESSLNNLHVYTENLAGAESRIRDADFAFETAQMTKYQTMQQAGIAILGQANQLSQGALRLIQ
jgi:flagellin